MRSRGDEENVTRIEEKRKNRLTRMLSDNSLTHEIEAVAALLAAGFDGVENATCVSPENISILCAAHTGASMSSNMKALKG
jgi:hypothetical protein